MGASAKTQQNQTSTYTPTAQAGAAYSDILKNSQAVAANNTYNPATAQTIAGLNGTQNQAFANIASNQGNWQPGVQAGADMVQQAGQGISAGDISKFYNPFQSDVINATMQQIGDQDAMQNRAYTANEASQSGLGGNGYFVGRSQLQGDQAQARNATLANLNNTGWQQALAAAQTDKTRGLAAGQASAGIGQLTSQLAGSDVQQILGAGNQQQAQQQAVNNAASQNATNEQLLPLQNQQWLAGITSGLGPLMGGTTTGTGQATQSQGKGAGSILGAGLSAASMLSDERVKENVEHIGATHDGQPIYSFRYKGSPQTQIGLMAQDVERGEHPEAVSQGGDGLKRVNYDTALRDAKADGGMALPQGLMGWSQIHPAQVNPPALGSISAPSQQGGEQMDYAAMGKKAAAGIGNLGRYMDPAKGWGAETVDTAKLGEYGPSSVGGIGNLASLFGFADGGVANPFQASPEEIAAIIAQESGGRDDVVSTAGARGRMQIMPETGRNPGFGVQPLRDDSPAENQRFGTDYLNAMLARYKGDRDAARIAYNGGPARADAWLKADRDDSVIPAESANYYKQVRGRLGGDVENLVAKAKEPAANGAGMGEPYQNKADRASGGMLKRTFGIDFNPLNLNENERKALLVAGLSMMSSGDVGKGGLAGMQYLTGVESGERENAVAQATLKRQLDKDAADLALRTRGENRLEGAETRQEEKDRLDREWRAGESDRKASEPTPDQKEYKQYVKDEKAAGREPKGILGYQTELKQAGRPQTNVTVSGDKKGAEEMSKLAAKDYTTLRDNARSATGTIRNLDAMESALNAGVRTGIGAESEQALRKAAVAMGFGDVKKVGKGELMQAIGNKLALAARAPGGEGGGMPGAMSDADREYLTNIVPGLAKTPEGNRQLIGVMRKVAQRDQQLHRMAVKYAAEHDGQLDVGFDREVMEFADKNPMFTEDPDKPKSVKTETIRALPQGTTPDAARAAARSAITSGAPRDGVIQRLQSMGVSVEGL